MGFLGIEPGQGARFAMERFLKDRASKDDPVAAYLLEHGRYFQGRDRPSRYDHLVGPMMRCHDNALRVCVAEPTLKLYTGIYMVGPHRGGDRWIYHSWPVDDDGVVEVTFPTRLEPGEPGFLSDGGVRTDIPWQPPEHWAYWGVEFDPVFISEFGHEYGLPVFDLLSGEGRRLVLSSAYSKRPFDPIH